MAESAEQSTAEQSTKELTVEAAPKEERTLIAGLMQKYLAEIQPFTGQVAQGNGRFRYPELDLYWLEEGRFPFLIRLGRRTIGFALAKSVPGGTTITEFYIAADYRHAGHGSTAAQDICARFPGRWAIRQNINHTDAQSFWRSVIRKIDGKYGERIDTSRDGRSWTVQRFTVPIDLRS